MCPSLTLFDRSRPSSQIRSQTALIIRGGDIALWKVEAGKHGEQESRILEQNVVAIGWNDLGDLSNVKSYEELKKLFMETYPEKKPKTADNQAGQIWAFKARIQPDDWAAVPLMSRSAIAVGVVQSDYEYRRDLGEIVHHTRRVKWVRTDIPRTNFDQDLLYSLGPIMAVYQITRNDAENRVHRIVEGKRSQL
jgi:restriction system protein